MTHFSLTSRLSALFTLAVCAALVSAGLVFNQLTQRHFDEQDQRILEDKLAAASTLFLELGDLNQLHIVRPELQVLLGGQRDFSALVIDAAGSLLFSEPEQSDVPQHYQQLQLHGSGEWTDNAKAWRGLQRHIERDGQQLSVLLMLDVTAHQAFLGDLTGWLWAALLLAVPGSILLGWGVASRGLLPVRELSQTALLASSESPPVKQLPTQTVPAELLPLALAFNAILADQEERLAGVNEGRLETTVASELVSPVGDPPAQNS